MPRKFTPLELADYVDGELKQAGIRSFVTKKENKRGREMWCAAQFSWAYSLSYSDCWVEVDTVDEQREFDFHLIIGASRLPFQVAEVLEAGRRRGDEYKKLGTPGFTAILEQGEPLSCEVAANRIREELRAKVDKWYADARTLHILLYVNFHALGLQWSAVHDATAELSTHFASVWLLTDEYFTCLHGDTEGRAYGGWRKIPGKA